MVIEIQEIGVDFWAIGAFPVGVALDLTLGDPRGWPHPVRAIGGLIRSVEQAARIALARLGAGARGQVLAGGLLAAVVVGVTMALVWLLMDQADRLGGPATLVCRALLVYWGLAIRSLGDGAFRVIEAPNLETARAELAKLVGRDPGRLDEPEIHQACVETIGEHACDSVVAPLFWFALGGPVGLWAYKAIHALNSTVGDRATRNKDFGRVPARLADLASFVPARLTWLLIALAAGLVGGRGLAAWKLGWRDGGKLPGPNTGWGEAALAGALGVRIGGRSSRRGAVSDKPFLGDPIAPITRETVLKSVLILQITALLAGGLAWVTRIGLEVQEMGSPH